MSFTSGVFSLVAGNPVVTGTTISSTWANNTLTDIATGLSTCVLKDGTQTVTANLPIGGFKLTGLSAGTVTGNSLRWDEVFSLANGAINEAQGADIASSGTINLTTASGNYVKVTGTTTITAITLAQGAQRVVVFTGALTLTNGASLILPGGANITTAAGDAAIFRGEAASVVRCVFYMKAASITATLAGTETLTNKTLTTPTLTSPVINTSVTGTAIATQAQQETGTATDVLVTPGRQQFHKGHPKAWASVDQSGVQTIHDSYGVTSIADAGVGATTVNFTTSFSSVNVCVVGGAYHGAGTAQILRLDSIVAASLQMQSVDASFNAVDSAFAAVACLGDI